MIFQKNDHFARNKCTKHQQEPTQKTRILGKHHFFNNGTALGAVSARVPPCGFSTAISEFRVVCSFEGLKIAR